MSVIDEFISYCSIFLILFGVLNLFRKLRYPYYFFFTVFLIFSISALFWSLAVEAGKKTISGNSGLLLSFLFLIAPLNFLFIRHILATKDPFSRSDYGHVLPAMVVLVSYLSFYDITGTPQMLNAHQMIFDGQSDWASGSWAGHVSIFLMVSLSLIAYSYFQWRVIKEFRMNATKPTIKRKQGLLRWLEINTIFRAFVFFLFLVLIFVSHMTRLFSLNVVSFSMILFIHPLMDFVIFVVDPQILVGMRKDHEGKPQAAASLISPLQVQAGISVDANVPVFESREIPLSDRIRKYLVDERSFLLEGFNLKFMAKSLNVHPMAISKSILQDSGLSFPDHVNKLKLELLDDMIMNKPEFRQYSMEAMAKEVGFRSKNAFYLSFRKLRGISPSEYYQAYLKKS